MIKKGKNYCSSIWPEREVWLCPVSYHNSSERIWTQFPIQGSFQHWSKTVAGPKTQVTKGKKKLVGENKPLHSSKNSNLKQTTELATFKSDRDYNALIAGETKITNQDIIPEDLFQYIEPWSQKDKLKEENHAKKIIISNDMFGPQSTVALKYPSLIQCRHNMKTQNTAE